MKKTLKTTEVSVFAHEIIRDLEEAAMECDSIDSLESPEPYLAAYSRLSRHRKLLYQYIEELETLAAKSSSVVERHRRTTTHLRF